MAATLAAGLFFYSSCTPAEKTDTKDYTQYVNTFIGGADNGHTFPGECYPFGMIQTSPVTGAVGWRYCSEYVYEDSLIWGFTQTHLNGTGCMDRGSQFCFYLWIRELCSVISRSSRFFVFREMTTISIPCTDTCTRDRHHQNIA